MNHAPPLASRNSQRYEIAPENWISVSIRRPIAPKQSSTEEFSDQDSFETVTGQIVDISSTGFKIRSASSFSFHEKLILEVPRPNSNETISVAAEVRWTQPDNKDEIWATGCVIADEFPPEYLNEIARNGILERRESKREWIKGKAKSKVESLAADHDVLISDVSATGVGIISPVPIDSGTRIQIEFRDEGQSKERASFTVRAIRAYEVDNGYFVGCKVLEGSTLQILRQAVATKALPTSRFKNVLSGFSLICVVLIIAFVLKELLNLF